MEHTDQNNNVEYGSHCAFAVSIGKMDVDGGKHSTVINGKTYLFSNPVAKLLFKLLPNRIEKADRHWKNN